MQRTHLRKDLFYTFDIETTTLITGRQKDATPIMNAIIWSGQFYDGTTYIQTRSLDDTIKRLKIIADDNKDNPYKVAIFVHNLSYEFEFIKDFFEFENILCTDNRKIIAAETDQLVFRCTYRLSNMGLEKFLKNENVPEEYQKTNMDYLKKRFPWTELTEEEKKYCANDVIGLHMAVTHRISKEYNEDINNLPLTSTGYVRKACRKAVTANKKNRFRFLKEKLDEETFKMCHSAFRGGNTHANRHYANKPLRPPDGIGQQDERSEYPAALILFDYPTKFFDLKPFKQNEFDYYIKHPKKWAVLFEVSWLNIRLKDPDYTPVPYISISKCDPIVFNEDEKYKQVDNGRVMAARLLRTIITETDYEIIKKQYIWDEEKITRVKVSKKKPIMSELKDKILEYYYKKTTLKQDEDSPDFDADIAYNYARSKELLNGIYGMGVSSPCRPDYEFDEITHEVKEVQRPEAELLEEYYNSFSSFLSYQMGIWCTAYARKMLEEGIECCSRIENGKKVSDLIYCDTDSCKYLHPDKHEKAFNKLNAKREKLAEKRGAYVDYEGNRYYLGIFTKEPTAIAFKTFGAKKYMYSFMKKEKDGSEHEDFKITISGVPKKAGKKCIEDAVKLKKLKKPFDIDKGFVFHGIKTTSCYMDHTKVHEFEVEGHIVKYASNIAMYPNSYTLGLTYEYELLLDACGDIMED